MTKKPNVRRKRPQLSERFEFVGDDAKAPGDPAILRAAVFPVYDRVAQIDRGLRVWRKTGAPIDADLRELWLHEMRQVRRLMASAGASEVIVDLIEMVEDDEEFGIVVEDSGQSGQNLYGALSVKPNQLRPKPRGGSTLASSERSRSQIVCNASAVALSTKFSGKALSHA